MADSGESHGHRPAAHCPRSSALLDNLPIADAVVGHGDRKKDVKILYLTISDPALGRATDELTFARGKTEIWSKG